MGLGKGGAEALGGPGPAAARGAPRCCRTELSSGRGGHKAPGGIIFLPPGREKEAITACRALPVRLCTEMAPWASCQACVAWPARALQLPASLMP